MKPKKCKSSVLEQIVEPITCKSSVPKQILERSEPLVSLIIFAKNCTLQIIFSQNILFD